MVKNYRMTEEHLDLPDGRTIFYDDIIPLDDVYIAAYRSVQLMVAEGALVEVPDAATVPPPPDIFDVVLRKRGTNDLISADGLPLSLLRISVGPAGTGAKYITDGFEDEVQINAAITEVAAAGGGIVLLLAGTYHIDSDSVRLKSPVELVGEGKGMTVIRASDGLDLDVVRNDDWVNGDTYVAVRRLTIDGNKVGQTGLGSGFITDTNVGRNGQVHLDEVEIHDALQHGAHLQRTDFIRISECDFHDNGTSNLHHGTYLLDCDDSLVKDSNSWGNVGNGFNAKQGTIIKHDSCTARDNGGRGIRTADYLVSNTVDCVVKDNGTIGIAYMLEISSGVTRGAIAGNEVEGNGEQGILVSNSSGVGVVGNISNENDGHGVEVHNGNRVGVIGNIASGNGLGGSDGILVGGSSEHGIVAVNLCRKTTRSQKFGVELADTCDHIYVVGNNLAENFTAPFFNGSSGLNNQIHSNHGADNPDPVGAHDFATKQYVDGLVQGMDVKQPARVAYDTNQALTGAAVAEGGVTPANGEHVLVTAQTAPAQNGLYVVNTGGAWSRAADADVWSELGGAIVPITGGSYASHIAIITAPSGGTLGSTAITVTILKLATDLIAGSSLSRTGTTLDVNVDNATVEDSGDALRVKPGGIKETQLGAAILKSSTPVFVANAYTIVAGDAWRVLLVNPAADSILTLATPGSLGLADGAVIRIKKNGTAPGRVTVNDGADQAWLSANGDVVEVRNDAGTWVVAWHAIQPLLVRHTAGAGNDVIPPLYTAVLSTTVGPGGGAGSGPRRSATIARSGGASGAPGGISVRWIPRSELGEPGTNIAYSVGAGPAGGAAVTTDDTSGNVGGTGAATTWGPNRAGAGAGGAAGGTGSATGGGTTSQTTVPMVGGGSTTTTANAVQPTSGNGGGGGGGGGLTAAGVSLTPAAGANGSVTSSTQVPAGAAGTVGSTAGGNGSGVTTPNSQLGGGGGGGGYAAAGAVGGDGGNGGQPGGGGGGGAASDNTKNSGKGGDGGNGETRALWFF